MLHILLPTLLFLFCKAINYATTTHLALALLPVLAAANIIDGSLVPFLNHIIISLTSLMIADLASKTTLAIDQPSNTITNTDSIHEPSTTKPAYLGMHTQNHPPIPTPTANNPTNPHPHPPPATTPLKPRLNATTPSSSKPAKETTIPISAADRVASLKKSLNAGTPIKPVREMEMGMFLLSVNMDDGGC